MKKIFMVAMAFSVAISSIAGPPKNDEKSAWKNAKKYAKVLLSEGWKVDGSGIMEEVIYKHKVKLIDENNQELIGNVIGTTTVKTLNQAQQWATTNACISYSKQAGMNLKGRIVSEIGAGVDAASLDNFYEGYEALVQKNIQGEVIKSFGVYREKKDGTLEYKAFYIVNEDKASKARMRAMENMMKESEFARRHAEAVSKFVQEGFQIAE
jgi:hypothetical protein